MLQSRRSLLVPILAFFTLASFGCASGGSDGDQVDSGGGDGAGDDTGSNGEAGDGEVDPDASPDALTDGPTACKGIGVYCGTRVGGDPKALYQCNADKIVGVARTCVGKCIESADSTQDYCDCPEGDGRYCGERVGGDANRLYDCKAGKLTVALQCAPKCNVGSGPSADKCAPCSVGNGAYCGVTVGGDKNKLYDCKDGAVTVKADCGAACVVKPAGTNDTCPACASGDGKYCGGPVGLDPNTLYTCAAGIFTVLEKCGSTCHVSPPKVDDYCAGSGDGLLCSNVQWWNSALTYGPYMSYGWWDTDLAIANMTRVQLRHSSRLDKEGVYAWGWMPEFTDTVTGKRFRFLHLQPTAKYTTAIGTVYPAGTVVGLSGGASSATGFPTYSTGAHLCVNTLDTYRGAFPVGTDACK